MYLRHTILALGIGIILFGGMRLTKLQFDSPSEAKTVSVAAREPRTPPAPARRVPFCDSRDADKGEICITREGIKRLLAIAIAAAPRDIRTLD